jgi:NADPH-dependent glutamate synthase beta subunit-like oxidoreductase
MKPMEFAKWAAVIGGGFVAVRVALKARDAIAAGADTVKAVKDAVVESVKTDLNPASTKNIVYRGVNATAAAVTNDPEWNLGVKIWEWLNPEKLAAEKRILGPSTPSNTQQQIELMGLGPNPHVAANWDAMAASDAAVLKQVDEKMSNQRSAFRAAEIKAQNEAARPSFLN